MMWPIPADAHSMRIGKVPDHGFRILYWLIKDALMYRLAAVTVDTEDFCDKRRIPVQSLPQDAINLVAAEAEGQGAELAMELEQDGPPVAAIPSSGEGPFPLPDSAPTFSGTIIVTHWRKRVVADNIAPEDILFTPTARDQDKASFLGFRKRVTASDLIEMGLPPDDVDELRSDRDVSLEDSQRNDSALLNEAERDVVG